MERMERNIKASQENLLEALPGETLADAVIAALAVQRRPGMVLRYNGIEVDADVLSKEEGTYSLIDIAIGYYRQAYPKFSDRIRSLVLKHYSPTAGLNAALVKVLAAIEGDSPACAGA